MLLTVGYNRSLLLTVTHNRSQYEYALSDSHVNDVGANRESLQREDHVLTIPKPSLLLIYSRVNGIYKRNRKMGGAGVRVFRLEGKGWRG